MIESRAILDFAQKIARRFKPERIILFGSYAYGTPTEHSDVDLLVVMPFEGRELKKGVEILSAEPPQFRVELLVRRPEEIARSYREFDPLAREAIDKGKVLYERNRTRMGRQSRRRFQYDRHAAAHPQTNVQ
jgi:predicted nucleotidyltransferase